MWQRFQKEVLQEFNSKYSFKKDVILVENFQLQSGYTKFFFIMTAEAHGFHLQ